MTVLHLFDRYLPHTMNWLCGLMEAMPGVSQWVAAPCLLDSPYRSDRFRYFPHPVQSALDWYPQEGQASHFFADYLIRAERYWPVYRSWLYGQLQLHPPDILHAHFAPVACHYMGMAQKLGIPLVASFYGYDFKRVPHQNPPYRGKYSQLFDTAAVLTTTGNYSPAFLENQGCQAVKIMPIPVSIAPQAFPYRERKKVAGQLKLVQIATITAKKGHLDTLKAFSGALRRCPYMHLTIAGERQDKALYAQIQAFIQANDLASKVRLMDFIPPAQVSAFLTSFDVFIHPSKTTIARDCEGAPMAILEAMATGLPVISTVHSDIPDMVLQGKTGLLAPEGDWEQLSLFIELFYRMGHNEYKAWSLAARNRVVRHFDINETANQLNTLYASLLHRSAI